MKTIAESRNRRLETTTGVVDRFTPNRINVKSGCVLSCSTEREVAMRRIGPTKGGHWEVME